MANTGKKIVLGIKKIQNPGAIETGEKLNNTTSIGALYVAPYTDLVDCPVSYSLDCPDVRYTNRGVELEYEFNLSNAVVNNPAIKTIRVSLDQGGGTHTFTLPQAPSPNYFSNTFTGLTNGLTYVMTVEYLDVSNVVIKSCPVA